MEAQKLYPKKPAKKMGAKKRAREMLKKGVQQAGGVDSAGRQTVTRNEWSIDDREKSSIPRVTRAPFYLEQVLRS